MKASRTKIFVFLALVVLGLFEATYCVLAFRSFGLPVGCDLNLRRNEIRCAHQGVNAFRIWNRETTLEGFSPYSRPDKENVVPHKDDAIVHAYPPWHTTMFWFYGWMRQDTCLAFMAAVFGFCICFIGFETVRLSKERFKSYGVVAAVSLILIAYPVTKCFMVLNYGVLVLALFLLMNKALERRHDVLAGLFWAVMMAKPQVGFLFFWPLLWHKRYLTIASAAIVCLAAATGTSFLVNESIVDLVMQVPKIGAPYAVGMFALIKPVAGNTGSVVFSVTAFALVGLGTWMLRKNSDFLVCCAPVALMIPIWTFTNDYDWCILLPAYMLLAGRAFEKHDALTFLGGLYCLITILMHALFISSALGLFLPADNLWISRIVKFAACPLLPIMAALFVHEKRKTMTLREPAVSADP